MSAYGKITRAAVNSSPLLPTSWPLTSRQPSTGGAESQALTVLHLSLEKARSFPGLVGYLHETFSAVVAEGRTYPQEEATYTIEAFEAYFFAEDVFIGVVTPGSGLPDGHETSTDLDTLRAERSWASVVGGFYYVKPNYPGRSSHNCNGGFVVPPNNGGKGIGSALGRSYLHYAPKLGYKASVFNLVYVNNTASVRIWEKLGFEKAGRIPKAGRLRRADGQGEEYVDAWVFYKSFG